MNRRTVTIKEQQTHTQCKYWNHLVSKNFISTTRTVLTRDGIAYIHDHHNTCWVSVGPRQWMYTRVPSYPDLVNSGTRMRTLHACASYQCGHLRRARKLAVAAKLTGEWSSVFRRSRGCSKGDYWNPAPSTGDRERPWERYVERDFVVAARVQLRANKGPVLCATTVQTFTPFSILCATTLQTFTPFSVLCCYRIEVCIVFRTLDERVVAAVLGVLLYSLRRYICSRQLWVCISGWARRYVWWDPVPVECINITTCNFYTSITAVH